MNQRNKQENKTPTTTDKKQEKSADNSITEVEIRNIINAEVEQKITHFKESFSGPLPHPRHLREYKNIDKDLPHRIVTMAEKNLDHMMTIEKRTVNAEIFLSILGWASSTAITFVLIYIAFSLIQEGKSIESLIAFIGAMSPLVGLFVFKGRNSKNNNLVPKEKE